MLDKTIAEKLGLTQDATPEQIAKALGVYKIIGSKEEGTEAFKKSLKKEFETNNELTKKITDLESKAKTSTELNDKLKKNLTESLKHIWKANNITGELPIDKIDINDIDYTHVDKSLAKVATDNGIKIEANKSDLKTATNRSIDGKLQVHNNVVI